MKSSYRITIQQIRNKAKAIRKAKKIRVAMIRQKAGFPNDLTYSRFERGEVSDIRMSTYLGICEGLGVRPCELLANHDMATDGE